MKRNALIRFFLILSGSASILYFLFSGYLVSVFDFIFGLPVDWENTNLQEKLYIFSPVILYISTSLLLTGISTNNFKDPDGLYYHLGTGLLISIGVYFLLFLLRLFLSAFSISVEYTRILLYMFIISALCVIFAYMLWSIRNTELEKELEK